MLGSYRIISPLPSLPQAKCFEYEHHISQNKRSRPESSTTALAKCFSMLRICKSHQLKQKQQTRSLNNHAIDFCECVLPLFLPAQLTSTDPKQHTVKNTRSLLQIKTRSNIKCITNISNTVLKTLWVHLSEKFCRLSSDWRNSAPRPAHLRI